MTTTVRIKTFTYFFMILFCGMSADAAEIRLKPQAHSEGAVVVLGDIANIKAASPDLESQLARVELFPAPGKGRSRIVRQREVRELLRLHDIDTAKVRVSGADSLRVFPASTRKPIRPKTVQPAPAPAEMMVVAVRQMERGEVIREADLTLRPADPSVVGSARNRSIVRVPTELIGMELTRQVQEGQPIDPHAVRRPVLIKRGDAVTVFARAPGVSVRSIARATEDASMGGLVLLESPTNRRRFSARVTGYQTAEIYASGRVIPASKKRLATPMSNQGGNNR